MSTTSDQDPAIESRDNPLTLEGEWVQEALESGAVDLDGSSATTESEEIVVDCPREVEDVGAGSPEEEGDRGDSVDVEEDSEIEAVTEEEEEGEEEEGVLGRQNVVVDAHHFPMAGFRFMFLDLVHAILNRVYYNDHILARDPRNEMDTPNTSESDNSSERQTSPEPIPSTVRASEYEHQGPDLPEVISTFPELEEPAAFEEAADHYLQETTAGAAGQAIEEMAAAAAEEVAEASEEEIAKEIIEQAVASEGENRCARQYEEDETIDEGEKKGEEKKNEEALDEMDPDAANYYTNKFS
uniref:Cancer/testis antigen 47 n=1 Tax=Mus musculus TaxID=10090 RepID=A2A3U9_MOUSE